VLLRFLSSILDTIKALWGNNNRSFAETMGYGYFSEEQNQVVVTRSALKGGIVSVDSLMLVLVTR
jgi:hypothetical protein